MWFVNYIPQSIFFEYHYWTKIGARVPPPWKWLMLSNQIVHTQMHCTEHKSSNAKQAMQAKDLLSCNGQNTTISFSGFYNWARVKYTQIFAQSAFNDYFTYYAHSMFPLCLYYACNILKRKWLLNLKGFGFVIILLPSFWWI